MGPLILLMTALFLSPRASTVGAEDSHAARTVVAGYTLSIGEKNGACVAHFQGGASRGEVKLSLTPPCSFVRQPFGRREVQSYVYPDAGGVTVLIIVGSHLPVDPNDPLTAGKDCGGEWQGLLIEPERVRASQSVGRGRLCARGGADEKEYWLFAHP